MIPRLVVCAHPSRTLDPRLESIADEVVWDDQGYGSNLNHARAWRAAAETNTPYCAVIEDDAVPIPDLLTHLPVMLSQAPTHIISAYCGRGRPEKHQPALHAAMNRDPSWIISTDLLHHVAVFTTPTLALRFAEVLEGSPWPCDSAIGFYARKHRLPISYPIPSLFDHADPEPLITDRHVTEVPRHAWRTGATGWDGGVVCLDRQTENLYGHLFQPGPPSRSSASHT